MNTEAQKNFALSILTVALIAFVYLAYKAMVIVEKRHRIFVTQSD
jgi:hypothetical protein